MSVLLYCILLLLSAFLIHLIIWKIRIPKHQTNVLLKIFFGTYVLSNLSFWALDHMGYGILLDTPQTFLDHARALLFFTSFTLAYVITYSALEVDSPSLVIINLISEAGSAGLETDALYSRLTDDILVKPRVNDLLRDNMAVMEDDRLRLTPKGRWFVGIFIFYRALLNAKRGG